MAEVTQVILCPYCGHTQTKLNKCDACGGLFDQLSLRATQVSMGPWFIRDKKRPYRPGCSYEILKKQIAAGKIKGTTILRGPTTRQFWSVARNVPGVAHLLGSCHQCGVHVSANEPKCHACNAVFRDVHLRNELGLFYPTEAVAQAAQKAIEREVAGLPPLTKPGAPATIPAAAAGATPGVAATSATPGATMTAAVVATPGAGAGAAEPAKAGGEDLLDEVLGRVARQTQGMTVPKGDLPANPAKPAPHAPVRTAAAPAPAAGLSFDPADDEEEEEEPVSRRGPGAITYILIIVVIIVIALQAIALLWYIARSKPQGQIQGMFPTPNSAGSNQAEAPAPENPSQSPTPSPSPSASAENTVKSSSSASGDSDDMIKHAYNAGGMIHEPTAEEKNNPLSPYYKPVDPHAADKNSPGSTGGTASSDSSTSSGSSSSGTASSGSARPAANADSSSSSTSTPPSSDQSSSTPTASTPPAASDSKTTDAPVQSRSLEARLARAKYLEDQNKPEEALKILKDIKRNTPLDKQPPELDEAITRVEAAIATKKSGGYFKVDP